MPVPVIKPDDVGVKSRAQAADEIRTYLNQKLVEVNWSASNAGLNVYGSTGTAAKMQGGYDGLLTEIMAEYAAYWKVTDRWNGDHEGAGERVYNIAKK